MRIASTQYHTTMNTALQLANQRVGAVLQQMASGQRMLVPSDDPIAQVRLMRLSREEAALDQHRENIATLQSRSEQNETYLNGIADDAMSARDLLVWALDGANVPQDLNAMANSLDALRESIFYTANSKDQEGRYVFSGTLVNTAAIDYDPTQPSGSRYSFKGNASQQLVTVGNGVTQPANVSLQDGGAGSSSVADLLNALEAASEQLKTSGVNINDTTVRGIVSGALNTVDTALNSVNGKIAGLGGQRNILQTLDDTHANVSLSNKNAAITLGQLDYGDAAVKLNGYTTAVQATQKAYAKVSSLSLFDVI